MEEFELIAKTFQGLEEVLAQELNELGAHNVRPGRRVVAFTGDQEMMYRANFCLRTAVRILKPIKHFTAKDADDVYAAVRGIDWSRYLDLDTTFSVDTVVYSEEFRHSKFVAYKVKDAIVDYFRETTGKRPNISVTNPDIKLNMHISDEECTLSLDASGESLHLRGYRTASVEAPINEVLAAGLLKLAGWNGETDFVDPFCGSGTLLVEAALMARNVYPGVFRKAYGFEKWKDFDRELLDRIYNDDSAEREFTHKIYGYDLNQRAVEAALANAKSAGVADCITVERRDIKNFKNPSEKALMVTNPPYGERLVTPDLLGIYRTLGERLKHEFTGNDAWVISSREECFDEIGLKASVAIPLYNGSLECDFRKYQLFSGRLDEFRAAGGTVKTDEERRRMAEKRRPHRPHSDWDNRRSAQDEDDDLSDDPEYLVLRNKHREFERTFGRHGRRDDDRRPDRRDFGRRDDDRRPDRRDFGRRDDDRRPDRRDFGRRDDDRRPDRRDFGRRDDDRRPERRDFGRRDDDRRPERRDFNRKPFDKKPKKY